MKHAKDLFSTTLVFVIGDQILEKSKICSNNTTYFPNSVCFDPAGGEGSRSVLTTQKGLASGDIDIGMLFLNDILPEKDKFTIVGVLPRDVYTPTGIIGFVSSHAKEPAAAKELLQYLISSDAQAIFKETGSSNTGNARAIALPAAAWAAPD